MGESDTSVVTVTPFSGLGKDLGYKVPPTLIGQISVGSLVRVPIRGQTVPAVVRSFGLTEDFPLEKLKAIMGLVQPLPVFTPELVKLAEWISGYYACNLAAVFESMIPAAVRKGMRAKQQTLIRCGKRPTEQELNALRKRSPKQAELLDYLFSHPPTESHPKGKLLADLKLSDSTCKSLIEKGFAEEILAATDRDAYTDQLSHAELVATQGHDLTEEQAAAVASISQSVAAKDFKVHLLHGVTGSGKTEVYLKTLQQVVAEGGGAIFLVPEVALTPQTVGRLRSRLDASGVRSVVWHSGLSDGERYDAWQALASGQARLVVGARSAVFSPVQNLKLIIVDEEHEPSYKQDEAPRYHGRDVAVYRAFLNKAICVLGSATPSLESYLNAQNGKYALNKLTTRVDDRKLPVFFVTDMRIEKRGDMGPSLFSRLLIDKLQERLDRKEQSILFINRRGFNTSCLCPDCGHVPTCDHCSVPLTYHRTDNVIRCHFCGFEQPTPQHCPKCHSQAIKWKGAGTQRIEAVAQKLLPTAKIVRIDADSMKRKNLFREILADFRRGKIDILVGTQMIAKGLDFPNVTLVGLLDADIALHMPDFRASERSFQLLVQVAGRAGRGDRSGEVVVQSFLPHSPPIQYARRQDFDGFIEEEMNNRRAFNYPPYRHLIHHCFRGQNEDKVAFYAEHWLRHLEKQEGISGIEIRGPVPAPIEKIRDEYRHQIWYFTPSIPRTITLLLRIRKDFPTDNDVYDFFDVDAINLM